MVNETKTDFFIFYENYKNRINDLIRKKKKEKINSCFSKYSGNFEDYSKCLYSFERKLDEKCKYLRYSQSFLKSHLKKCLQNASQEEYLKCLENIQILRNSIFEKIEKEINFLQ